MPTVTKASILDRMESRASALLDEGKLGPAKRALRDMLRVDQNSIGAHFQLARLLRRRGDYEKAQYHARRTIRLSPHERNAYLNLGVIYDISGRWRLAVRYYQRELAQNPDSPETLWNLGNLWFERRQWRKAAYYFQRCFRLGYKIRETVDKLGASFAKLDEVELYAKVFSEYVRLFPADPWGHANLGRSHIRAGRIRQAVLRLRRAMELGDIKAKADLDKAEKLLRGSVLEKNCDGVAH